MGGRLLLKYVKYLLLYGVYSSPQPLTSEGGQWISERVPGCGREPPGHDRCDRCPVVGEREVVAGCQRIWRCEPYSFAMFFCIRLM